MIEDIVETMKEASLCALGNSAVNPVLTSLKYFRDEYKTYINHRQNLYETEKKELE